jgi:hypothetical protein
MSNTHSQPTTDNAPEANNSQQQQATDHETHQKAAAMIRRRQHNKQTHSQNITVDSNPFPAMAYRRSPLGNCAAGLKPASLPNKKYILSGCQR